MILARKSGMLISVEFVRETPKATYVQVRHGKKQIRVSKASQTEKLFENTKDAFCWMDSAIASCHEFVKVLQTIADIAEGSTTANSLQNIAKIARQSIHKFENPT